MAELLEKALTTAIAFAMLISVGAPITSFGLKFVNESYKLVLVNDLLEKLDTGIMQVLVSGQSYIATCYLPSDLIIWSKGSTLVVEYYVSGAWGAKYKSYPTDIMVHYSGFSGHGKIIVSKLGLAVAINLEEG